MTLIFFLIGNTQLLTQFTRQFSSVTGFKKQGEFLPSAKGDNHLGRGIIQEGICIEHGGEKNNIFVSAGEKFSPLLEKRT